MKSFLVAALLLTLTNCVSGKNLTDADITSAGTKTYSAPKGKVFTATADALKASGYKIAVNNPGKGLLVTEKLLVSNSASAHGTATSATATQTATFRQYSVKISEVAGKTQVVAKPSVYVDSQDVSDQKVWMLDGEGGEHKLWSNLFQKIETYL